MQNTFGPYFIDALIKLIQINGLIGGQFIAGILDRLFQNRSNGIIPNPLPGRSFQSLLTRFMMRQRISFRYLLQSPII